MEKPFGHALYNMGTDDETVWCRDCREVPCICDEDWDDEDGEDSYSVLPFCVEGCGKRVNYEDDTLCWSCQAGVLIAQANKLRAMHDWRQRVVWALARRVAALG